MKAVGAAMVVLPMTPGAVTASGMMIGLFFLLTSLTGILNWLARLIGPRVANGLQLGLALLLALSALPMMEGAPVLGALILLGLLLLMWRAPRLPAALIVLPLGTFLYWSVQGFPEFPSLSLTLALPTFELPAGEAWLEGLLKGALPQIPLTVANAILVTAALVRRYYPNELHPVSEKTLGLSTGLGNLLTAPLAPCPCAMAPEGWRRSIGLARAVARRPWRWGCFCSLSGFCSGSNRPSCCKPYRKPYLAPSCCLRPLNLPAPAPIDCAAARWSSCFSAGLAVVVELASLCWSAC